MKGAFLLTTMPRIRGGPWVNARIRSRQPRKSVSGWAENPFWGKLEAGRGNARADDRKALLAGRQTRSGPARLRSLGGGGWTRLWTCGVRHNLRLILQRAERIMEHHAAKDY